jgi:hypothetical protein
MRLKPGDRVRITAYLFENIDEINLLAATKDSIGTVLSYQEVCDHWENHPNEQHYPLEFVKKWIDDGTQYPIRFDIVAPPSKEFLSDWGGQMLTITCDVGKAGTISVRYLEKLA